MIYHKQRIFVAGATHLRIVCDIFINYLITIVYEETLAFISSCCLCNQCQCVHI